MSWHSKLLDETLYLYVSNVSFDRTIVRASTNWTSNKNIYIHIHNWFFFSVIQGTGNVPKETRRSNMIGKQPPLQRFASMRRLFAGSRLRCAHDWFVWPRPTSVVVYLCLNLRNVSYIATSHRHTPCHVSNLDPTSFFSFHHSLGRVYRLKGDPLLPFLPRYPIPPPFSGRVGKNAWAGKRAQDSGNRNEITPAWAGPR